VGLDNHALANLNVVQRPRALAVRHPYTHRLVGGVGEQPFFAGMDGIEQALTGKLAAFKDGEAPESSVSLEVFSSRTARRGVGSFGLHSVTCSAGILLQNRHHRRLVLVDRDGLSEAYSKKSSKALVETSLAGLHRWCGRRRHHNCPNPTPRAPVRPAPLPVPRLIIFARGTGGGAAITVTVSLTDPTLSTTSTVDRHHPRRFPPAHTAESQAY